MFRNDQEKKIDEVKAHNAIFRKENTVTEEPKEKRPRFFNQNRSKQENEDKQKEEEELKKIKQDYIKENLNKKEVVTKVSD